jgi:hypothetical protein
MKGEKGSLISLLAKKRYVGWSYYVFALSAASKKIYQFKGELDSSPVDCFSVQNVSVQPDSIKSNGRFCLQFYQNLPQGREKGLCLAADTSDIQFTWIRALASCGVEILPTPEEENAQLQTAQSIFDFEVTDIEGRNVSLEKYRGHVTLIVNVASQ